MDLEKLICKRTAEMKPSGIRRFFDIANEMEGVVSLGVGEPDFKTPYAIRRAAIDNLQRGNTRYTANSGLIELRKAISDYMRERFSLEYDPSHEIMVTVGGSEGIDLAARAFIEEGDEVLIPEPSYVAYAPIVSLTFGVPVPIPLKEENDFRLTAEELEAAITPKTKMLILPFPNNPTGSVMRREHLEAIAEVLRRHDNIVVVSDEIYAELTYNGRHVSIAELPDMWGTYRHYRRFFQGIFDDRLAAGVSVSRTACGSCPNAQDSSVCADVLSDDLPVGRRRSAAQLRRIDHSDAG